MKYFTLFCFLILSLSLSAQIVPEVQKSLITKKTATWCSNCGSWGWTFFKDLIDENSEKAYFFAAHYSGDLVNQVSQDIANAVAGSGQPRFSFNETAQPVGSSNTSNSLASFQILVDDFNAEAPVANVGLEALWDEYNQQILVLANTKFFQNTIGEYYTAVYLVENNVVAFQQSQGANAMHPKILRASFTDNSFGNGYAIGEFAAGDEFLMEFTYDPPLNPLDATTEYEIVAVVWLKTGDDYSVVNVNGTSEFEILIVENIDEITTQGITIFPTVFDSQVNASFQLTQAVANANAQLLDINGKLIESYDLDALAAGQHQLTFDASKATTAGTYYLNLDFDGRRLTKTIVKQ